MPYRDSKLSTEVRGKIKQFYRLLMSYSDFNQANQIATRIMDEKLHRNGCEDRILLEALNSAMVVAYARPFSGNDKNAETKINDLSTKYLKGLSRDEKEIHDIVIEDRNQVIAHSDSEARDYRIQVMTLNEKKILTPWSDDTRAPLTEEALMIFIKLSENMREITYEKRMKLEPELYEYFEEYPKDYLAGKNV